MKKYVLFIISILILMACSPTSRMENGSGALTAIYQIQTGGNWGGIIEDTEVDAVSGATKIGLNLGAHAGLTFSRKMVETGIDFLSYKQTFTYLDNVENYDGTRDFSYGELRIPLTYNFQFFRDQSGIGRLQLRGGLSAGYRIYENIQDNGLVPAYTFNRFSLGPNLGISITPIKINNKLQLGLYADLVRASTVYKDHYITSSEVGNMSYLKFGLQLNIK